MKKQSKAISYTDILRQKAELSMHGKPKKVGSHISEIELLRLIHELEVHQIELEMQNEELTIAKERSEDASQKYLELYDFAPSGYFTISKDGKIIDLNLSGSRLLGNDRKCLKNSLFGLFISPDTSLLFDNFLKRIFSGKTKETCELTLYVHKHTPMYVYLTGMISGNGEKCLVNMIDISERRQAEAALRESEERNRTILLQTSMDGFWKLDRQGRLLEVNEPYSKMSGYSIHELLAMNISDLEVIEEVEDTKAHIEKIVTHGEERFDTQHRRKDGSIFDVEISTQYQPTDGGRFIVFLHDITERKKAEEALVESEQRYRSLFEESKDAIFLVDLDSGKYNDCNKSAEKLTGYNREEIIHMKIGAFLTPTRKGELKSIMEAIISGKVLRSETEITTREGNLIPVEFSASLVTINKKQCILSMLHDISERKAAEEALKQSEERVRFKLQSILSPEGSIADLELNDIIDAPSIQKLMDSFYELAQIPMAIIDIKGNLLVGVGWQDICTKFHRVYPESCRNCIESDIHLTHGIPDGEFRLYKCKNNMWDIATPLIIGGEHKGNLFMGQFFFDSEPINYKLFNEQADKYGFAEHEYLNALEQAPRLSRQKLDHAKAFFLNFAKSISQISYSNIKLARAITQQKKVEESLRENERLLHESQAAAHISSYTTDLISGTWKATPEIYEIFGIDETYPHTLDGWLQSVHPDFREELTEDLVQKEYSGNIFEHEYKIIRIIDGEERWVHGYGRFEYNDQSNPVRLIGTIQDITERKEAEVSLKLLNEELENRVRERTSELLKLNEALRQTEEKYRTVADFTYDWEYWIGADDRIHYMSPSVERITGYTAEEFRADPQLFKQIVFPDDLRKWERHSIESHITDPNRKHDEIEFRIVSKTEDIRWISHICTGIFQDGKYLGLRVSNSDITEKVKAENKLLNVTVEVEERERNRFSLEMHDDLGPLLSAIKLYFQWLSETENPEKRKIITEKGSKSLERAIQTTRDIAHGLGSQIVNNIGYVGAVQHFVQSINETQKLNINFKFNSNKRFSNFLEINLYRITTELINNTLKYAFATLVEIEFNFNIEKNSINFTYIDDGIGFDLENAGKRNKGLGLLNIQQRIKLLRGIVRMEASIGKGMKVYIELPVEYVLNSVQINQTEEQKMPVNL